MKAAPDHRTTDHRREDELGKVASGKTAFHESGPIVAHDYAVSFAVRHGVVVVVVVVVLVLLL